MSVLSQIFSRVNVKSVTSAFHQTFHRGNVKLLVALGIPLGIAGLFMYSQYAAKIEEEKYRQEENVHPTAETTHISNYSLKEIDDFNHIHWQLVAKEGLQLASGHDVHLKDVIVEYFDGPTLKMRLSSPEGDAQQLTKYVKLIGRKDCPVLATGEDGKPKLQAQVVELIKRNEFAATGDVSIEWPEKARVTGNFATGQIDLSNMNNFKLKGNTHAIISMHDAEEAEATAAGGGEASTGTIPPEFAKGAKAAKEGK